MRRALVVVGKPPEPGLAKTRLVPPLSAHAAAVLYGAFLLDSVGLGQDLGWERVTVVHPSGGGPALATLLPAEVRLLEQPGQGLADALLHAFATHLAEGFSRVVVIGSDSPTLPLEALEQACLGLDTHDVSLGPSADGGYYLIGLREPHPELFEAIDWSTSRVYGQTRDHAGRLGLRVHNTPQWYDVDEPADLERLQRDLTTCSERVAPNTRVALKRLADEAGRDYPGVLGTGGTSSVGVRPDCRA